MADFEYTSRTQTSSTRDLNRKSVQLTNSEELLEDVLHYCVDRYQDLGDYEAELNDEAYYKHNINDLTLVQPVTDVENDIAFTPTLPLTEAMLEITPSDIELLKESRLQYFLEKYARDRMPEDWHGDHRADPLYINELLSNTKASESPA